MSFDEDDRADSTKEMNSSRNVDDSGGSDEETQDFSSQSPLKVENIRSSEFQLTVPFSDTVPIEDETQGVEDPDCEANVRTQLLIEDSDGEETDGTEVLSEDEGGSGDESGEVGGDDSACLENRKDSGVLDEKAAKGFVLDSDASNDGPHSSGSARRSFMSVRAASLRASGRAAASRMTAKGTHSDPDNILSNSNSGDIVAEIRDTALVDTQITQTIGDHDTSDDNENMNRFGGKGGRAVGTLTARKLFVEETSAESGSMNNDDIISGGGELPNLLDRDHNFAGLSYVGPQDPGQFSQDNAMNVVDRFLSINYMESSQEVNPGKTIKEKSPPIPSAKRLQTLAHRANLSSPVSEVEIFDWVDAREDEGGGDFFSKRKEALFGSSCRGRRSFTQPQKARHLTFRKDTGIVEKLGEEKAGANFHQKIFCLTRSDSRLALYNSKKDEKIPEISETKTRKNLFEELDEQLNPESLEQHLEENGISNDVPEICDVGIGTQMAAEAMEALACGIPACDDTFEANVTEACCGGVIENNTHSGHDLVQKRISDSEGILRSSKRRKILGNGKGAQIPIKSRKVSRSQTKDLHPDSTVTTIKKKGKAKAEQHLKVTNGNVRSGRRSSKRFEQNRVVNAAEKSITREVDGSRSSSKLKEKCLFDVGQAPEDYRMFTPIASRTRQSLAERPLKRILSAYDGSGNRTNKQVEGSTLVSSIMDPKQSATRSKLCSNGTGDDRKTKIAQQDTLVLSGANDMEDTTTCQEGDVLNYRRGRRTRCKSSGDLLEAAKLDCLSTIAEAKKVSGQSITRKKRSKIDARSARISLDMKRNKQLTDGSSKRQDMAETGLAHATINCSLAVMNEKMIPKDLVGDKISTPDGKISNAHSVSYTEGVESVRLEESRREQIQLSGSACVTPVIRATHGNPVSPVCIGNEHQMQSYKKSLSRSSLIRELVNLDANEVMRTPALKDFRKRKDMASARVLFSNHLDEDIVKQQKKILARLGASVASSSSEATHFVTDKFVRTRNMLEAIALGKPVVTHLWLKSCGQASCFIDEKTYILRDVKKEKEIGFSMPVSLARACKSPLLQGKRVVITPNIKPSKDVIVTLVRAVHGQAVERIGRSVTKDEGVPDDLLVLSCEEDYAICIPFLEKGAMVYSSELLLNGIVIQKLEYARHCLFTNDVKRTRSTIWLRKDDENFLPVKKRGVGYGPSKEKEESCQCF